MLCPVLFQIATYECFVRRIGLKGSKSVTIGFRGIEEVPIPCSAKSRRKPISTTSLTLTLTLTLTGQRKKPPPDPSIKFVSAQKNLNSVDYRGQNIF